MFSKTSPMLFITIVSLAVYQLIYMYSKNKYEAELAGAIGNIAASIVAVMMFITLIMMIYEVLQYTKKEGV